MESVTPDRQVHSSVLGGTLALLTLCCVMLGKPFDLSDPQPSPRQHEVADSRLLSGVWAQLVVCGGCKVHSAGVPEREEARPHHPPALSAGWTDPRWPVGGGEGGRLWGSRRSSHWIISFANNKCRQQETLSEPPPRMQMSPLSASALYYNNPRASGQTGQLHVNDVISLPQLPQWGPARQGVVRAGAGALMETIKRHQGAHRPFILTPD